MIVPGCVKGQESKQISCNMKTRPKVLYNQARVALDSYIGSY